MPRQAVTWPPGERVQLMPQPNLSLELPSRFTNRSRPANYASRACLDGLPPRHCDLPGGPWSASADCSTPRSHTRASDPAANDAQTRAPRIDCIAHVPFVTRVGRGLGTNERLSSH